MKKQIAIVTNKLITGGVEKALLSMLRAMDPDLYEIDLYLVEAGGELEGEVPDYVQCCPLQAISLRNAIRRPGLLLERLTSRMRLCKKIPFVQQCCESAKMYCPIKKRYDIAIAYHAPNTVPMFYVIDRMEADQKILWLHGDINRNSGGSSVMSVYHEKYDRIIAVSRYVRDSFLALHPDKADATEVIYNYIDADEIRNKAKEAADFPGDHAYRILTVGRLSKQKGIDLAFETCRILRDQGIAFRWYICGEGVERKNLESLIDRYELHECAVLLGNCENPYPLMKHCDLYVQTSRFEGYCTTTNEARILGKAVITTDVSGVREQFEDGLTGWIVPFNAEKIAQKIMYCMTHPKEIAEVEKRLLELSFGNEETDRKLQKLLWNDCRF